MPNELEQLQKRVKFLEKILYSLIKSDRIIFQKDIQILDGRNIQVAKGTGTSFGTETTQKVSVYGITPVVQGNTISDPSGQANNLDSEARTAINALIDRLQAFGIIA